MLILYISSYYNKAYPRLAIKTFLAMVVLDYLIFTHYTFFIFNFSFYIQEPQLVSGFEAGGGCSEIRGVRHDQPDLAGGRGR